MYNTRNPAHQNQSPQIGYGGWDAWNQRTPDAHVEELFGPVSLTGRGPEATLMVAVLEDAFLCFQKRFETDMRSIQQAQEAKEWFFSEDSYALFSFVSICTVLGLEPEYIRKGLKHWEQSRVNTPQRKRSEMQCVAAGRPRPRFGD